MCKVVLKTKDNVYNTNAWHIEDIEWAAVIIIRNDINWGSLIGPIYYSYYFINPEKTCSNQDRLGYVTI